MKSLFCLRWVVPVALVISSLLLGCGKKEAAPVSERIQKIWVVQQAKENATAVYVRGASTNIKPGYSQFKLTLTDPTRVTLQDLDGTAATGTYSLVTDQQLVLKNLTPQPTGTNGQIEFSVNSFSDSQMELTRTSVNLKTGGSTNQYTLVPQ